MESRTIKRGDTLLLSCTRRDGAGVPVVLTGMTITAKVRYRSFSEPLTVALVDPANGVFSLSSTNTAAWPVATLKCDVQFVSGTVVTSSQTFAIVVEEDVTF
jgi:hypothetical protein